MYVQLYHQYFENEKFLHFIVRFSRIACRYLVNMVLKIFNGQSEEWMEENYYFAKPYKEIVHFLSFGTMNSTGGRLYLVK